jgi:NTP pyrophosphatase (non-canonical NTP hydrolase)
MRTTMRKIITACKCDPKTIEQMALKLSEECGEVSQAVLSYRKAPGCANKGKTKADVIEEIWDVIICATALLYKVEDGKIDTAFSTKIRDKKLAKWEEKFK